MVPNWAAATVTYEAFAKATKMDVAQVDLKDDTLVARMVDMMGVTKVAGKGGEGAVCWVVWTGDAKENNWGLQLAEI